MVGFFTVEMEMVGFFKFEIKMIEWRKVVGNHMGPLVLQLEIQVRKVQLTLYSITGLDRETNVNKSYPPSSLSFYLILWFDERNP